MFVDMYLRVQKNDPEGTGCTRTHVHGALTSLTLCLVHVAKFLHEQASARFEGQGTCPFFPSKKGGLITKQGYVKQVHKICGGLKSPPTLRTEQLVSQGSSQEPLEQSSLPRAGAMGVRSALKLYIKDAPVKAMTDIALEAFLAKGIRTVTRMSLVQPSASPHGKTDFTNHLRRGIAGVPLERLQTTTSTRRR